jgi:hypothetical protein
MPAGDGEDTGLKSLKRDFPSLLPEQGTDPKNDERIGMHYFVRFNGVGVSPYPAFLRDALRTHVWPLVLNDPAMDCVFMDRLFLWTSIHVPLWIYLLLFCDYTNSKLWFGAVYAVYALLWFDQFVTYILALHCIVHRAILKTQSSAVARALKWFFVWVVGPMMGETPETYAAHHVNMHHPTNNGYEDLSTTMTYRRDSKWDFARYLARFFVVHFELWNHLSSKNPIIAKRFVTGELCWLAVGIALYLYRPFACALLYVLPVIVLRLGMTAGNFGQHAFINDASPFTNTCQSGVILNSAYNIVAFNDGYHIQHHEYPVAAYHELPHLFQKMMPDMARDDSVVFNGGGVGGPIFDWVTIWALIMSGDWDMLAEQFVDVRALVNKTPRRPKAEIIKMLQSRTCKVYDPKTTPPPKKE